MARQTSGPQSSDSSRRGERRDNAVLRLPAGRLLVSVLGVALVADAALARAAIPSGGPRIGVPGMRESDTGSLLVAYYEAFLRDKNIENFRQQVSARYTEGTLTRLLDAGVPTARRAAVLALGLVGTMESNGAVARALRDSDPVVRDLADTALWSIWFRADTPENNAILEQVLLLIRQERLADAVALASRLIARAPNFAEAYNQRAIAHFFQNHFQESAEDCQRVLERNPYHLGALSGLGRCQMALGQRREALKTFRRALRLQPFSKGLRETVSTLEAEEK
jgi:tetratricopeptide (TPR) repeat protein